MKKLSFIIATLAVISLSSCYVEERGGNRYHHPFWHPRPAARIEIRGSIDNRQNNPIQPVVDNYSAKK